MSLPELLLAAALAFAVAVATTPAGVSGATILLPVQVSILAVPNPALTPTNLLYNVIATPGALLRFAREGRLRSPLTIWLLAGPIPGVIVGAILRVEVLNGARSFMLVIAAVLAPIGLSLLRRRRGRADGQPWAGPSWPLTAVAFAAGVIGGVYGIGGGSLLGPVLSLLGVSMATLAPAALTSTWVTSVIGVFAYSALQAINGDATIAPDWLLGVSFGAGGILGTYLGARLQPRLPENRLRQGLGLLSLLLAIRYLLGGLNLI